MFLFFQVLSVVGLCEFFIDMMIAHTLPQKKLWLILKYFSVFLPKIYCKKKLPMPYGLAS